VLIENEPKPETQTEIVDSSKSEVEKGTFTSGVVIEGTVGNPGEVASVPPDPTEKEHSGTLLAKVDFFPKPVPATVEELQRFSALCHGVMSSNASGNRASSPNASST
jgi:hypothetical protein